MTFELYQSTFCYAQKHTIPSPLAKEATEKVIKKLIKKLLKSENTQQSDKRAVRQTRRFFLKTNTKTFIVLQDQNLPLKQCKTFNIAPLNKLPIPSTADVYNKKAQLSLTNPRDACEKFARFT